MKRKCRLHGWWMVLRLQLGRPRRATSSVSVLGIHPRPGLDITTDAPEEEQEMRVFGWPMTVALPGKLPQQIKCLHLGSGKFQTNSATARR